MKTLTSKHKPDSLTLGVPRYEEQKREALATGNRSAFTAAGLREVVATRDIILIKIYLLNEMGIGATVGSTTEGICIGIQDKHSFAKIWSVLRGDFVCISAMTANGRQALFVIDAHESNHTAGFIHAPGSNLES